MVGIGISTATQVGQEMGLFQEIFGENAARYIALGGTLLGTGLSLGGGIYSVSSASSATNAMDDIGKIATAVDRAKTVAESTHSIVQGVRNLRAAELQHDADLMHVEAQRHKRMIEFVDRMIEAVIDDLEGLQESARKATEICQSMSQTHNQTLLLAANFKG
jgi:anaerobic selenocysteine-containing dehydrogenase